MNGKVAVFEEAIKILRFMQGYGDDLVKDVAPEDFCRQPLPGMNHPAWIIGHLAVAADGHSYYAGGQPQLRQYRDTLGFNSTPSPDPADYPPKDELLTMWHAANERFIAAVLSADPQLLEKPTQGPLQEPLPNTRDFLTFSMTSHTSLHLGQLSAWRRADGRPRLF